MIFRQHRYYDLFTIRLGAVGREAAPGAEGTLRRTAAAEGGREVGLTVPGADLGGRADDLREGTSLLPAFSFSLLSLILPLVVGAGREAVVVLLGLGLLGSTLVGRPMALVSLPLLPLSLPLLDELLFFDPLAACWGRSVRGARFALSAFSRTATRPLPSSVGLATVLGAASDLGVSTARLRGGAVPSKPGNWKPETRGARAGDVPIFKIWVRGELVLS